MSEYGESLSRHIVHNIRTLDGWKMAYDSLPPRFVSYDGDYPNLCSGTLVFRLGNKEYSWDRCLKSGGGLDDDYNAYEGPWTVEFPEDFQEGWRAAVTKMVNEHVPYGCCGGCS